MTPIILQTQQATARAQLCPGDLDLAINVLTRLLDQHGERATIATHTRVRKGRITRIDFSLKVPRANVTDLTELDNNTALAWIQLELNGVHQDSDTCNEWSGLSHWLDNLEFYFGNHRVHRMRALIED